MLSKLKAGDSIGVFSASAPVTYLNYKKFLKAKEYLSSKGFNIVEGALTNKYDYYRSGTIKERAEQEYILITELTLSPLVLMNRIMITITNISVIFLLTHKKFHIDTICHQYGEATY